VTDVRQLCKSHLLVAPEFFVTVSCVKLANTIAARMLKHGRSSRLKPTKYNQFGKYVGWLGFNVFWAHK